MNWKIRIKIAEMIFITGMVKKDFYLLFYLKKKKDGN